MGHLHRATELWDSLSIISTTLTPVTSVRLPVTIDRSRPHETWSIRILLVS